MKTKSHKTHPALDMTQGEWEMIIESLRYTRKRFQEYIGYPDTRFRLGQIAAIDQALERARAAKKAAP